MKCPFCVHLEDKVVDSRESKEGEVIRRRRECLDCGKRFTTYERIDQIPHLVVKKDGRRERFDRAKVMAGLLKACEKRNVSVNRGLYVELSTTKGGKIGDLVRVEKGTVSFKIRVQAPSWVACDTVQIIKNGEVAATHVVKKTTQPVRFSQTITVEPEEDAWYIVVATGAKSMAPLVHNAPVPITPLGFTNPIWIDADGDGKFTSLYERAGKVVTKHEADPAGLAATIRKSGALRKFALSFLAQHEIKNKTQHFIELLPDANLLERLFIYAQLGNSQSGSAKATLKKAAGNASFPVEKLAVAVARVQSGEKAEWPTALSQVSSIGDTPYLRKVLLSLSTGNFLRDWHIAAPFYFQEKHGLQRVFPPEKSIDLAATHKTDSTAISWRQIQASQSGIIDLVKIYGAKKKVNAYAYTEFDAKEAGEILFLLGSDDGVVMWVNGKEVHRNDAHRGIRPGDDFVVGAVKKGKNRLLLKVENGSGGWGFCVEPIEF